MSHVPQLPNAHHQSASPGHPHWWSERWKEPTEVQRPEDDNTGKSGFRGWKMTFLDSLFPYHCSSQPPHPPHPQIMRSEGPSPNQWAWWLSNNNNKLPTCFTTHAETPLISFNLRTVGHKNRNIITSYTVLWTQWPHIGCGDIGF